MLNEDAGNCQANITVSHSLKDDREHLYYDVKGKGVAEEGAHRYETQSKMAYLMNTYG